MQKLLFFTRFLLAVVLVALAGTMAIAQEPDNPFHQGTSVSEVFNWYTVVYGAAVTILTRLQAVLFPKAGNVPRLAVRYLIVAAVVGGLFLALGVSNAWGIAIGFLGTALTYDKFLEPLGILKTPKPTTQDS